jgi:HK97 family phage major capsid protein
VQNSTTILFENVVKMYSRMYDGGKSKAIWLANGDTLPQLMVMNVTVGNGGSAVWLPAGGASAQPYNTLFGRPMFFNEHCSTLGTVGDIIFGDWSQYLIGQKAGAGSGLQFATSIHLKFEFAQTAYRVTTRIDGQPWWASAVTPAQGSNTVSPFVTLATR